MDYKDYRQQRSGNRSKLRVPHRGGTTPTNPLTRSTPAPATKKPKDLDAERSLFGFDDIPVGQDDDKSLREVLEMWIVHLFHLNHPDNKLRRAHKFIQQKRHRAWKDDLKWALQADLPEDAQKLHRSKPTKKQHVPTPAHPTTIAPSAVPIPAAQGDAKSIEININFDTLPKLSQITKSPKVQRLVKKVRAFKWTQRRIAALMVVTAISIGGISWLTIPALNGTDTRSESLDIAQKPDYSTLLPSHKSIETLGGWKRISPPEHAPVFAYSDTIDGIAISVSQQPIPDSFQPDIDKNVAELARNYIATDKISTGAMTIYVGTSARGPQSAILAKNNVLILIKSAQKIADDSWAAYANSLH